MNISKHDLSDDELDHLFRDSAEKMDFDFDTDSWTKMSQKLDAVNLPASGKNQAENVWLKRGVSILLALLFLIGAFYLLKPSSKPATTTFQTKQKNNSENETKANAKKYVITNKVNTDDLKNNASEPGSSSEKTINNSESTVYDNKKAENKINASPKLEVKENVSVNVKTQATSKSQKDEMAKNENSVKLLANQTFTVNTKTSKTKNIVVDKINEDLANKISSETSSVANENDVNKVSEKTNKGVKSQKIRADLVNNDIDNQIATKQGIENGSQANVTVVNTEETPARWQLGDIEKIVPKNGIFKANLQLPIIVFESPQFASAIPTSKSTSFKRGLNLRLGISPDLSLVTVNEIARLGSNLAVLLEYRFNNRLSLHTGIIRSMKYYDSYPDSYKWPSNWSQPPMLIDINATCKMLDIPLNIRYDITQKPNSRLFVSSGLTSYIMLNEKYTYNYENQWDPKIKWRNWSGKTGPYYFSVLNFSFGYEHQIFRRLSLQAEPFVKVPISKVGFGKVNLSTIGIFISAKYPIARF